MGARYIARKVRDRGGAIVGGPDWDIKHWNDQAMSSTRTVYLNEALSIALATPQRANSGWQYLTTVQFLPTDVLIDLADTTDIRVGDVFQLVDGAFVAILTVKVVTSATRIEVLAAPGGAHTYAVGATAGDPDNLGDLAFWIDDSTDAWRSVTKVGSATPSIPVQLHVKVSATSWQEEGVDVATRSKFNAIGTGFTLADDAGNSRVNVTHADLSGHGGAITDAGHGVRATANAHDLSQLSGTLTDGLHGTRGGGLHNSATGEILDTASNIAAGATLTKTAAIGFSAKAGMAVARNEGDAAGAAAIRGAFVLLGSAAATDAASFSRSHTTGEAFGAMVRGKDSNLTTTTGNVNPFGTGINLRDAYISGTDATFVFHNGDAAAQTVSARIRWKCW